MANIIKLPEYEWSEQPREVEYPLPDSWEVHVYDIAGANKPELTPAEIKTALASPIGSPPLREIAQGKKKVVILFDDMTRGTQVSKVVPAVLEELSTASITDSQIEFICAKGLHQAWDRVTLGRKIGYDIIERFPVYNHCSFMNCTELGTTSYGTKVSVNTEVMSCDLKISIGGLVPHPSYGFGGGGKIIMPGVCSYDTVADHHNVTHVRFRDQRRQARAVHNMGVVDDNPLVLDAMEMARMAGLNFSINCMQNHWGETVAVFAGDVEAAYWAGVKEAKSHYRVIAPQDFDIVIANAYCKEDEATIAANAGIPHVTTKGGDIVLIANSVLGQIVHYLSGSFGRAIGGRFQIKQTLPSNINHYIYYSEFTEARTLDRFAEASKLKVLLMKNWTNVIMALQKWHGDKVKVAVFTDGNIQVSVDKLPVL